MLNQINIKLVQNPAVILLFLLQLLVYENVSSQVPYNIVNYSNNEGFNQNTIFAIEQDKLGFLWIGTSNGLIRYDGYDFLNYSSIQSFPADIPRDRIKDIYSSGDGLLWVASLNTIHVYSLENDKFYNLFPDSVIHCDRILESEEGDIWILGDNLIRKIQAETGQDTILFHISPNLIPSGFNSINITDLVQLNGDLFIMGTNRGLYSFNISGDIISFDKLSDHNSLQDVTRILNLKEAKNVFWIGTTDGLVKAIFDNNGIHIVKIWRHNSKKTNSLPDNRINEIIMGKNDNLLIGTVSGGMSIYCMKSDSFENYSYEPLKVNGLSSARVNCIYIDNFDIIWIGTAQGGLCKLDKNQKLFINLTHNPFSEVTLPQNLINYVYEDSKNYLWVATHRSPLSRSRKPVTAGDISSVEFDHFNHWFHSYGKNEIYHIYEDQHGYFWLSYPNSLVVYDPFRKIFKNISIEYDGRKLPLMAIKKILPYGSDKLILAGDEIVVIENPWKFLINNKYTFQALSAYSLPEAYDFRNFVQTAILDSENRLWVGTWNNGIFILEFEGNQLKPLIEFRYKGIEQKGLSHNKVFCLYEDAGKNMWVGTYGGGLNKLSFNGDAREPVFEYINTHNGLPDNAVYGIIPENDSLLWISTDMGLCRFNLSSGEIDSYNISHGISSNNFRMNAYSRGSSGYYYFGGLNGLTLFRPENIRPNPIPPVIRMVSLNINNIPVSSKLLSRINARDFDSISGDNKIILSHKENNVSFEMMVLHYSNPLNNRLSFYLEGFDPDWVSVDMGKHKQVYTNLPPGEYHFMIKGFNEDGLSNVKEIRLPLIIKSPWYKRWWSYSLFGLLIFSTGLGVFLYLIKMERLQQSLHFEQKDKERIQQVNQSKLQFFTSISHEFRTPLSLISASAQLMEGCNFEGEPKKNLSLISRNTNRLLNLIDQLLTFRKSEQGFLKLNYGKYRLSTFFYPITEAFENFSYQKGINFNYTIKEPENQIIIDLEKMERVLFNILSNAFKFTPENGTIYFEASVVNEEKKEYIRFDVSDNGRGIPKDELNNIFERFYQLNTDISNVGTGIGLSLSKSIVELHNGHIKAESEPGVLTRFTVFIPKKPDIESIESKLNIQKTRIKEYFTLEENRISKLYISDNLPLKPYSILIVDDEAEFRDIVIQVLKNEYRLLEAESGTKALEILKTQTPDLIVSDVMMDEMNGYELCKRVKSDIQSCHIPVILLTALGEEEMQIRGMELGADAYITKPFQIKILLVTIRKLIENKNRIKEHFSKSITILPELQLTSIDQRFIESVNLIIEKNLDNSGFGVDMLAREMCLSLSHFFRKFKMLTGQVPSAYIRNYRLEMAARMIERNPDKSLKHIMFEIGIESASYFTHAFKKKYGVPPSEYYKSISGT